MTVLLNPVVHEAADALRLVGLRDRLRCPECRAVGTWKPHGSLWDRWRAGDTRGARRWLCKWCGLYLGPEGQLQAFPDPGTKAWSLPRPYYPDAPDPLPTPRDKAAPSNPWGG